MVGWILCRRRETRRKFGGVSMDTVGGMKTPSSRKDLMFDIVRREEALGERRIMGS